MTDAEAGVWAEHEAMYAWRVSFTSPSIPTWSAIVAAKSPGDAVELAGAKHGWSVPGSWSIQGEPLITYPQTEATTPPHGGTDGR